MGKMTLLTIAEISRELNIPESTLRSWRDRFDGFIPATGTGRKKRYKPEAVDVLRSIAEMSAEGLTANDIAERLSLSYQRVIDISDNSSSEPQQRNVALEAYGIQSNLAKITAMIEQMMLQQAEREKMQQEIDQLHKRIDELEKPWYKRKRGKP
jgi:DNA-binding transcriptional MerR regulator